MRNRRITQTRWKLTLIAISLFLIEGAITVFVPEFPLTELLAAQGAVIGGYLGAKTVNNIKEGKITVQND